jgi:hypothetical protein
VRTVEVVRNHEGGWPRLLRRQRSKVLDAYVDGGVTNLRRGDRSS